MRRWRLMAALIGLGALAVGGYLGWLQAFWSVLGADSLGELADYLRSFGVWTPLISLALMVLQAVIAPLPGSLVAAANGAIFGLWWGILLSWLGGMAGAAASFGIARWLGQRVAARLAGRQLRWQRNPFDGEHGFWIVLLLRLVPFISFDFISYVAGVSQMPFRRFMLASAVGMVPGTIAWTTFGHDLTYQPASIWRVSLPLAVAVLAYAGLRWWLRRSVDPRAALLALSDDDGAA